MSSPVFHLYESAHEFNSALSAVNLIPQEWNGFTVTNGLAMTEDTVSALAWRDVYLATVIDNVSAELENKYIGGKGIKIDKDTWTVSRVDSKQNFNFENGLNYKEEWNNFVYMNLDDSEDNRLEISANELVYSNTAKTTSSYDNIIQSATAFITTGQNYYSEFPQNCSLIYMENEQSRFSKISHGGYPGYRENGNYSELDNFNVLNIATDANLTNYSATKYKVYYYPSSLSGVIPDYEVNETITPISSIGIIRGFNPDNQQTVECDGITASGSVNFISGNVNMVPDGVLFIW